jgi:hypothetical protein
MFKTAWILPAVMLVALLVAAILPAAASAAEGKPFQITPQSFSNEKPAFKGLPGVVPEESRVKEDAYKCTSDIEEVYRYRGNHQILWGDTAPTRIYRCETKSGITYTGTRMPNSNIWAPGINPYDLPK